MREQVLWRKISRIILQLAKTLDVNPERAMDIFYNTDVCKRLQDERYGLHLMSDRYILHDILTELETNKITPLSAY